jgi:hypothetical protein
MLCFRNDFLPTDEPEPLTSPGNLLDIAACILLQQQLFTNAESVYVGKIFSFFGQHNKALLSRDGICHTSIKGGTQPPLH